MTLRIANAAGFLGDDIDAPLRMAQSAEFDVLTLGVPGRVDDVDSRASEDQGA